MFSNLGGWTAIVILVVVLLLFGAAKLPALAKSAGQSMKIFKREIKSEPDATSEPLSTETPAAPRATDPAATEADDNKPSGSPSAS